MSPALLDALREALRDGPGLEVALAFGSLARGSGHPGSDLDVAVLPTDRTLPLSVEAELAGALERASGRSVDLVRIDHAPLALAWRIARDGILLAEHQRGFAARWRARVALEHAEFAPTLAAGGERYRAALARGTPAR